MWATADIYLRGVVTRSDYGDYILPFTVLRRMECIIEPHKEEVLEFIKKHENFPEHLLDASISAQFNLPFYSDSPLNLELIAASEDNVKSGLLQYISSFNSTVRDVFTAFKFSELIDTLEENGILFGVVKHFSQIDLSNESLGSEGNENAENVMGDLFENLMYRSFSENGQTAGEYYTPREVIRLMVDVLFSSDDEGLQKSHPVRSIYDPAAGTGGMLLVARNALLEMNETAQIVLAGQESMADSYALGKSDLIVAGAQPDAIRREDTLKVDMYEGQQFDYVLSNPPYGSDWNRSRSFVEAEAKKEGSRFSHGLPAVSDGQMLFLCHVVHKMKEAVPGTTKGGRAGVVTNGSPLFTGGAESGPDRIRNWLINEALLRRFTALKPHSPHCTAKVLEVRETIPHWLSA